MRNFLLALVLICNSTCLFAQTEPEIYKTTISKFQSFYNREQYDSLFSMFAPVMQTALPADATATFFNGLQSGGGKITKTEFVQFQMYKITFERLTYKFNLSIDDNAKINGFNFTEGKPLMERNITKMILPFKGTWDVVWGGDTKEQNYHVSYPAQKNAFDILIKGTDGKSFKTDGKRNEDYYAFGQEVIAPCDGEIVMAVDGVKDNTPKDMNAMYVLGNSVIIKTEKNEFLYFAHFKQYSVKVKQGQKVRQGQLLGLCGNSGNSSEPHIHFHIQHVENPNVAIGIKCYFDQLTVNGQVKTDYSPVRNDKIQH